MQRAKIAAAADADWGRVAKACADQLTAGGPAGADAGEDRLGVLYLTDHLAAQLPSILTFLRERTAIAKWIGTVGLGICATGREYFDEPAAVAMALPLPKGTARLTGNLRAEADIAGLATRIAGRTPGLGIVHGDPRNPSTPELVTGVADRLPCFLVGGLSASRSDHPQIAGKVADGGVAGVLIDAAVPVVTGLSQGCAPAGPARTVEACQGNVIAALGGAPPLGALEADLGLAVADNAFLTAVRDLHVALLVAGSDTGDYTVRNLMGIDPERGWIAIGATPAPGDRLMFCRRNPAAAAADLRRMLADVKGRAGRPPRAALYHSCLARGPNLFPDDARELKLIAEAFGDLPLVGFFGNGEISNNRLYGYTGVLTLFL